MRSYWRVAADVLSYGRGREARTVLQGRARFNGGIVNYFSLDRCEFKTTAARLTTPFGERDLPNEKPR